ncbi:MAG: adenylate/guanylate cyclase domain-containing protein, partial [bacterium]
DMRKLPIELPPFLSGKRLLTTQTFRNLFRSEVIKGTESLSVKSITLLFTDLKGSTALYDQIGDLKAFALVQQHFESLGCIVQKHAGAIVKTIGDAVMATFLDPVSGVKAALEMLEDIEAFNQEHGSRDLILKIGLHHGPSLAVTSNDRLDYFGQTVNVASRVQGLADAEEIYLTREVYDYPGVKALLDGLAVTSRKAALKGIQSHMEVFRLAPRTAAGRFA